LRKQRSGFFDFANALDDFSLPLLNAMEAKIHLPRTAVS
jgi:hypothetical protein